MAKVIYLRPEFINHKPIPVCPLTEYYDLEQCHDQGISFKPSTSTEALALANSSHRALKLLRVAPKEIIIVDYTSLYAPIPIYTNPLIIKGTIDLLPTIMVQISDTVIDKQVSCYNLTIYYSTLWPEIFVHWEDLHNEETY